MIEVKQVNIDLLNACTEDVVDLPYVEGLLKQGAQPLGYVENHAKDNVYNVILCHYLGMANYDEGDDSVFF